MKVLRFTFLAMVTLLYFGCTDNNLTGPRYVNQFPLRVGMFWEYQSKNFTLQRRILEVQRGPQNTMWYKLETTILPEEDSLRAIISFTFLAFEGNQLREYEYENCTEIYNVLLQAPLILGNSWLKYIGGWCATGPCDSLGPCPIVYRIPLPDTDSIAAYLDVFTPASYYRDCVEMRETGGAYEFTTAWFKPGIGFVKYGGFNIDRYYRDDLEREDFVLTKFGFRPLVINQGEKTSLLPSPVLPSKA